MTLNQLNRIASEQRIEPDLPGVHSSGLVKNIPKHERRKLFNQMREATGPMADTDFEQLDAKIEAARRHVWECQENLKLAEAEFDRLNEVRAVEINRRLAIRDGGDPQ